MNLEDLFIPAKYAALFSKVYDSKVTVDEYFGKFCRVVSEDDLVELFLSLGALYHPVSNKNELNENGEEFVLNGGAFMSENQYDEGYMYKASIDLSSSEGINILKALFLTKNLSLKQVAEAYGGKSAAANLSNFFARSDEELSRMRKSTVIRIAEAMDCSPTWILSYLKIE